MARKQCKKCPWKKSTNPHDIPNGYDADRHAALRNTIANPNDPPGAPLRLMACHESPVGAETPCVGWLHHQLGVGNNLALRVAVWQKRIDPRYELDGEQHKTFEDTLP